MNSHSGRQGRGLHPDGRDVWSPYWILVGMKVPPCNDFDTPISRCGLPYHKLLSCGL